MKVLSKIFKSLLTLLLFLNLSSFLLADDPTWTEALKADLTLKGVIKNSKIIFNVSHTGNVAKISLPKNTRAGDPTLWVMEINYEGQYQTATWNKKARGWTFHLMGKGAHTVYVSKRLNNVRKLPYAWFVLPL